MRSLSPLYILCNMSFLGTGVDKRSSWFFCLKIFGIRKSFTYDCITFGLVRKLRLFGGSSLSLFSAEFKSYIISDDLGIDRRASDASDKATHDGNES